MHNFRELKVWQRAIDFVVKLYELMDTFPKEEKYGLIAQMRRSAVSIPSNIAEGTGRGSNAQFARFLEFSLGSLNELMTQIEIANRVKYFESADYQCLVNELTQISNMLYALYKTLTKD
jgi:four helix bundle protein